MKKKKRHYLRNFILILLGLFVALLIYFMYRDDHPYMTYQECADLLSSNFGTVIDAGSTPDEVIMIHDAEIMTLKAVNKQLLQGVDPDNKFETDDDYAAFIADHSLEPFYAENIGCTEKQEKQIIGDILDFCLNPDNFPKYDRSELADNTYDARQKLIVSHNDDYSEVVMQYGDTLPQTKTYLLLPKDDGYVNVMVVLDVEDNKDGTCTLQLRKSKSPEKAFKTLNFSGCADFSQILGENYQKNVAFVNDNSSNLGVLTANAAVTGYSETQIETSKINLSIDATIKGNIEKDKSGAGRLSNPECETVFSASAGGHQLELTFNDKDKDWDPLKGTGKTSKEGDIAGEIKAEIKDLQVCVMGHVNLGDYSDSQNNIQCYILGSPNVDGQFKTEFEGNYYLGKLSVPVPVTMNTISVNINFYMSVSAELGAHLYAEIDKGKIGLIGTTNGIQPIHTCKSATTDFKGVFSFEAGPKEELAVAFCEYVTLLNPDSFQHVKVTAESLTRLAGYENFLPCVDVKIAFPIVTLEAFNDDKSVLYHMATIVTKKNDITTKLKFEIIPEKKAPVQKKLHFEADKNNRYHRVPKCTRLEKKNPKDLLDAKLAEIRQRLEAEKQKTYRALEAMIENMLEQWLTEVCTSCLKSCGMT